MKLTTRNAEIIVAVLLALCSIGLMIKSAQNRIDWTIEDNMGAGFMPFWLSLGMLICTIITISKLFLKKSPQSTNNEPFIDPEANKYVYVTILSLIGLILGTAYLGIYISLIFFLFLGGGQPPMMLLEHSESSTATTAQTGSFRLKS